MNYQDETPSSKSGALLATLHPVTRFLVVVAILHLTATLIEAYFALAHPRDNWASAPLGELLAIQAKALAYSLSFVGGAASVEFLFRIWDELKLERR